MGRDLLVGFAIGIPLALLNAILAFSLDWSGQAYNAGGLVVVAIAVTATLLLRDHRLGKHR